jgi:hypothetical protein
MASLTKLSDAARWYARNNIPVFPLKPRDKKPLTVHGFKDASADAKQVSEWWNRHPDANIGIPMGAASHLLLLDLDFRGESVVEDRADIIRLYGPLPETAEVSTGAGRHLYFRFPGGQVPPRIAPGVELKCDGGYSVAPPSIHPNGSEYAFDGTAGPKSLLSPAEPPQWLLDLIRANGKKQPDASAATDDEKFPEGERNNRLASLAGKLRRAGLSADAIAAALIAENQRRCSPPLPDAEVAQIARSIARYPAGHTARVNVDSVEPTVAALNSLSIFGGRIQFRSVKRRGGMILAEFADGSQGIWRTMSDLMVFSRSQAILAGATGLVIPTPPNRIVRREWEPAAALMLRVADRDKVLTAADLKDEFSEVLRATFKRAGTPYASDPDAFVQILGECTTHSRDPQNGNPPRCCVWVAEESVWVHQPSLLEWLSTPMGKNKHYPWADVREALFLLDFRPRQIHRSAGTSAAKANVWQGSLDVLTDDETEDV